MFLIIFLKSGEPFIHGNDRATEYKYLSGVEDDRGSEVVEKLLVAASGDSGFWDTTTKSQRRHTLSDNGQEHQRDYGRSADIQISAARYGV